MLEDEVERLADVPACAVLDAAAIEDSKEAVEILLLFCAELAEALSINLLMLDEDFLRSVVHPVLLATTTMLLEDEAPWLRLESYQGM